MIRLLNALLFKERKLDSVHGFKIVGYSRYHNIRRFIGRMRD